MNFQSVRTCQPLASVTKDGDFGQRWRMSITRMRRDGSRSPFIIAPTAFFDAPPWSAPYVVKDSGGQQLAYI